jgi:hypothetical protein
LQSQRMSSIESIVLHSHKVSFQLTFVRINCRKTSLFLIKFVPVFKFYFLSLFIYNKLIIK